MFQRSPTVQLAGPPGTPTSPAGGRTARGEALRVLSSGAWVPLVLLGGVALLGVDVAVGGAVLRADLAAHALAAVPRSPSTERVALVLDEIGLRGVTGPLLVAVALGVRWKTGRWRSLVVVLGALLSLNLVVGVLKLVLARGQAVTGDPHFLAGGQAFPSGHSSNVALTASLLVHLAHQWAGRRVRGAVAVLAVTAPSALMCGVSLFLGFHWLSDLLAGVLVGLAVTWGALRGDAALQRAATARRLPAPREEVLVLRGHPAWGPAAPTEEEPRRAA